MMYKFTRMWQYMRSLLVLTAVLALPGTAVSYAQSAPPVMPDHTVYGRLGTGTGSGPGQAIPFGVLGAQLANNIVNPAEFGAVCNGVHDDTAAFQTAVNTAQSANAPLRWTGKCATTSTVFITSGLDFAGYNPTLDQLLPIAGTNAVIVQTTSPVYLHDFGIVYTATSSETALVIQPTSSQNLNSRFTNLYIVGAFNGVNFVAAAAWVLSNSLIGFNGGVGLTVQNTFNVDDGDGTAYSNSIEANTSGGIGVVWTSSGGFRFVNNKVIGNSLAEGYAIELASGAITSDLFIIGNSFEGFAATNSVGIQFSRLGAVGSVGNIHISDNEFATPQTGIQVIHDSNSTSWAFNMQINNNNMQLSTASTTFGYKFDNIVPGIQLGGGTFQSNGTTNQVIDFTISENAQACTITPYAVSNTTVIADTTGGCSVVGQQGTSGNYGFSSAGSLVINGSGTTSCSSGLATSSVGVLSCVASSRKFKIPEGDLKPSAALATALALKPAQFRYRDDAGLADDGQQAVGLYAEDVEEVDPRLVGHGPDGKPLTIRPDRLVGILAGAIQAQQIEINELKRLLNK